MKASTAAITVTPNPPADTVQQLVHLRATGQHAAAIALATALTVEHPTALLPWKLLGCMLDETGQTQPAQRCLETARALDPADADVNNTLGVMYLRQGRLTQAKTLFTQAVAAQPSMAMAWSNLGIALHTEGDFVGAEKQFRAAVALNPHAPENLANLATVLQAQHQFVPACEYFERALALAPDMAGVHCNLGLMLSSDKQWQRAEASFARALSLQPLLHQAHHGLSVVWQNTGRLTAAEASCRKACALSPDSASYLGDLGNLLGDMGRLKEAAACLLEARRMAPADAALFSAYLFQLTQDENVDPDDVFRAHQTFGARFDVPHPPHSNDRNPNRTLRVGFVSGDLRNHPVAYFMDPLWQAIDRRQIEIWVYHSCGEQDFVTPHLRALSHAWHQVEAMGDDALTAQIRGDAIDVLVDLSGHTAHNRLPVFGRKPAPIQVTSLGYPNTTGLHTMDYLLCDRFNAPHGSFEHRYVEKFARIPSSSTFLQNLDAPPINPLPMLTNGHITFGSFNRVSKLGDQVMVAWARLLHRVPGSRMLIGNLLDEAVRQRLTQRFAQLGITADRLDLQPKLVLSDYLRLHHAVDIVLDTWPYAGGTTTNHALWMGVPVLTVVGPSRSHCQGSSSMGKMGLPDWIATDVDDFVERGARLARDAGQLAVLRAGMRERWRQAPLRQPRTVARGFESALRQMWRRWCQGLPAAPLDITLSTD